MDQLVARRRREWALIMLVGILALSANLPNDLLKSLAVDPRYLVAALGLLVLLALFLYVRFFFFLLYVLLAIGANIPDQWAEGLGISRGMLVATLAMMVVLSLINARTKLLPTGLQPKPRKRSPEGIKALLHAIEKDNLVRAEAVLVMDVDPNLPGETGHTPLTFAAERGSLPLVRLLLANGADPHVPGPQGMTAAEFALKGGHAAVFEAIKAASATPCRESSAPAPNMPGAIGV